MSFRKPFVPGTNPFALSTSMKRQLNRYALLIEVDPENGYKAIKDWLLDQDGNQVFSTQLEPEATNEDKLALARDGFYVALASFNYAHNYALKNFDIDVYTGVLDHEMVLNGDVS